MFLTTTENIPGKSYDIILKEIIDGAAKRYGLI